MARRGYVQLVNGFYTNDKVQELCRSGHMDAIGAFCMALTYCGDHLTDGFIPRRTMRFVIGATDEQLQALCDVGMLEEVEEGWIIHDYLKHNRSMEQVMHVRKKTADRVAKYRETTDVTALRADCNGVTSGQTPEHQNTRTPEHQRKRKKNILLLSPKKSASPTSNKQERKPTPTARSSRHIPTLTCRIPGMLSRRTIIARPARSRTGAANGRAGASAARK